MAEPLVQVTDPSGRVIDRADMMTAFDQQLIRNTVYVMLRDRQGRYILQKRSDTVPNFPGWWDASAGGHIDDLETPDIAARRELVEELGLSSHISKRSEFYFEARGDANRLYKYYVHFYVGDCDKLDNLNIARAEVAEVKLFTDEQASQLHDITPIAKRLLDEL